MIQRVNDLYPKALTEALLPLGRMEPPWMCLKHTQELVDDKLQFRACFQIAKIPPLLVGLDLTGNDWPGMLVLSRWLAHGPKIARPSVERCEALAEVEVRLRMEELALPFPEVLVELPASFSPFVAALVGLTECGTLVVSLVSAEFKHDILSLVRSRLEPGWTVEDTLGRFSPDCEHVDTARRALRVAINSCLMLSGSFRPALPDELLRDRRLSKERSERGERAKGRVPLAVLVAEFDQELVYREDRRIRGEPGEPTGKEMPPHWRRGHWRMQPCGAGRQIRKRVLIPPVLVRKDRFDGDASNTSCKGVLR